MQELSHWMLGDNLCWSTSRKENAKAEILAAILLVHICRHPDADLGKVRIDLVKGSHAQLGKVLTTDKIETKIMFHQSKRSIAKQLKVLFSFIAIVKHCEWMDQYLLLFTVIHSIIITCIIVQNETIGFISIV